MQLYFFLSSLILFPKGKQTTGIILKKATFVFLFSVSYIQLAALE